MSCSESHVHTYYLAACSKEPKLLTSYIVHHEHSRLLKKMGSKIPVWFIGLRRLGKWSLCWFSLEGERGVAQRERMVGTVPSPLNGG